MTDLLDRYAAIGAAIRRDRDATESQAKFCERIGVSTTKLRELEKGQPGNYRLGTLIRISAGIWNRRDVLDRILEGEDLDDVLADGNDRGTLGGDELIAHGAEAAAALLAVLDQAKRSAAGGAPVAGDAAFDEPRRPPQDVLEVVGRSVPMLVGILREAADRLEAMHSADPGSVTPQTFEAAGSLAASVTSISHALAAPPDVALAAHGDDTAARLALEPKRRRNRPSPPVEN